MKNQIFADIKKRMQKPVKQWIKAIVWCIVYILFILWVGSWGWFLLLPVVFDAFITGYIPWTWWKKSKNKAFVAVMGWVDAIVFALIAVYFINTFLFQNYQIPTPSLEKSLLVGDFLFVSKASYGPRVPNTPLSFPLVQHTFPIINTPSFIKNPQWEYRRLRGFDSIERNDIVVFNFPTGDTVAVKMPNPDYYTLCFYEGYNFLRAQNPDVQPTAREAMAKGRILVRNKRSEYGDIVFRPVDRRENYVKRCVGLPGDWLEIRDNVVYINGEAQEVLPGIQLNYFVQTDGRMLSADLLTRLGISKDDRTLLSANHPVISYLELNPQWPVYHFPMTSDMAERMTGVTGVVQVIVEPYTMGGDVFPLGYDFGWNRDNYGPIYIPKKGARLRLNAYNYPLYERIIRVYEGNSLEVIDGQFVINGVPTDVYQFKMDYYWMMGDNRHNSADSRSWGFVPEDHVVGRPVLVWLSLDKDKNWFEGKIRFNRFFKDASR